MGIADMAEKRGRSDLAEESHDKWKKYMMLQIAVILSFIMIIIPPLAIVYIVVLFIITVILAISILGFIKRCNIL